MNSFSYLKFVGFDKLAVSYGARAAAKVHEPYLAVDASHA